jgi:hypothetical protein
MTIGTAFMTPLDEARIYRRAESLAMSGRYDGWLHIELALKEVGVDAHQLLESQAKRQWLNSLCIRYRKDKSGFS